MNPELKAMIRLQGIDGRIEETSANIRKIPALIEKEKACIRDFEATVGQAKENIEEVGKRQRQAESDIQNADQKLRDTRGKQVLVKTNEEYRALTSEIESLQEKIGRLEDEVLEAMEKISPLKEALSREAAKLEEAGRKVSTATKGHEDTLSRLKSEQKGLEKERAEIITSVSPDWIARYETVRKNRGGLAVCPIVGQTCQGCRMPETISRFFEIRDSDNEIFSCSNCGRILYYQDAEVVGAVSPLDKSE
ncbi:MAG: hypothetical protein O2807_09330 [bacterium]|nr:hypothetical protein [bacterium]